MERFVYNKYGYVPPGAVNIMRPGPFGNPFEIGRDGDREEVIAKHAAWIQDSGAGAGRTPRPRQEASSWARASVLLLPQALSR
jgi:hypothetical protein